MLRFLLLLAFSFSPLSALLALEENPVLAKVRTAKEAYYADRDKAEAALIALLTRRLETAKKTGDLKTLEALQADLDAFRSAGTLPKLVPIRDYEIAMKLARVKYENVMTASVKSLTQAGSLEEAKELDKQLKAFQEEKPAEKPAGDKQPPAKQAANPLAAAVTSQDIDPAKVPANQFRPGLVMFEFPRDASQSDDEKSFIAIDKLTTPAGPPALINSLNWKYTSTHNAIASGFLKIPKDGEYQFQSNNFYDRNAFWLNNEQICKYRDGSGSNKIVTVELKAGLVPIKSVGYVNGRGTVTVKWQPPGATEMTDVPGELLYFYLPKK